MNNTCLTNPPGSSNAFIVKPSNVGKFAAQVFAHQSKEVAAALESVFPRVGLRSFVALTGPEKAAQLQELAGIVLLLGAYCCAADQSAHKPETAEDDAGDHLGDENDLLKGIIDEHGDDDLAALEGDDDMQSFDDFDEDEDGHGVGMHDVGDDHDHTGSMSPEEEKIWREDEERFFKEADADKDGHLDKDEYTRAMMKEMSPHVGADPDEMEGGAAMPPPPSPALAGTGPLSTEGMTEDEKTHFEELGKQFVEEDLDKDGKISLEEWFNMMFHDMPQEPEFEDGHEDMWDHEHHHELDVRGGRRGRRESVDVLLVVHEDEGEGGRRAGRGPQGKGQGPEGEEGRQEGGGAAEPVRPRWMA